MQDTPNQLIMWDTLLAVFASEYNYITAESLQGSCRKEADINPKIVACLALKLGADRAKVKLPYRFIEPRMSIDHATISYYVKQHNTRLVKNLFYKKMWDTVYPLFTRKLDRAFNYTDLVQLKKLIIDRDLINEEIARLEQIILNG